MKECHSPLSAGEANYFITDILISCILVFHGATKATIDIANSVCEAFHLKNEACHKTKKIRTVQDERGNSAYDYKKNK